MHAARPITPMRKHEKSRELQRSLYQAAKKDSGRRFHALYDRIYRPDILRRAWEEVRGNGGAPGRDGKTICDIESEGIDQFLDGIRQELIAGSYRPEPVLRVYIPKPDGRQRPLGIPVIKDRVVQQACKIVIEPIYEARFLKQSYGFRPKKSAQQAASDVKEALVRGWHVVDMDIQGYFDNIDQELLMKLIGRNISDRRVLKLIRQWLRCGVWENGMQQPTRKGSPQGGVISPLLANIYLHVLDKYWEQECNHIGRLFRYADDAVVVCRTQQQAQEALVRIRGIMARLKLTLHPEKTKLVNMNEEGFNFLGFHFCKWRSKRTGKLVPYMVPAKKPEGRIREAIREKTSRKNLRKGFRSILNECNGIIAGWRNYFQSGSSRRSFSKLDKFVFKRFELLVKKIRKKPDWNKFLEWYNKSGPERFCPNQGKRLYSL